MREQQVKEAWRDYCAVVERIRKEIPEFSRTAGAASEPLDPDKPPQSSHQWRAHVKGLHCRA